MAIPKNGSDGVTRHPNRNGRGKLRAAFALAISCLLAGGTLVATAGNAAAATASFTVTHTCTPGAPAEFQVTGTGWTPNADVTVGFNISSPAVNGSGNGNTDGSGSFSLTATEGALMAYPGNGAINATFEVLTTISGVTKEDVTQKVTIAAINCVAPTASFTSTSTGLNASFNASGTTGTGPLTYAWDFGDGSTGTGAAASHTYTKAGNYTVKLTVNGPAGTNTVTHQVTVSPTPPPVTCKTSDVQVVSHNADLTDAIVSIKTSAIKAGVTSCDVSMNSYGTDGPTWPTSGTQVFLDHATVHLTATTPQGELKVQAPACGKFGQTDLYVGTKKYDGTDGALPHYPNSATPPNLVAHWNGQEAACPTPPPAVKVTPAAPTFNDVCGTANDTYTIPSTEGVEYKVNGTVKAAGTYPGSGIVTVTADALKGYVLADGATASWTFTFTNQPCYTPPPVITPPSYDVTVTTTQPSCTVATPTATVTTDFAGSIGYTNPRSNEPVWVYKEVPAGTYTVKFPALAEGGTASWLILVTPLDDTTPGSLVRGPFNFERPSNCTVAPTPTPKPSLIPPVGFTANTGVAGPIGSGSSQMTLGVLMVLAGLLGLVGLLSYLRREARQ